MSKKFPIIRINNVTLNHKNRREWDKEIIDYITSDVSEDVKVDNLSYPDESIINENFSVKCWNCDHNCINHEITLISIGSKLKYDNKFVNTGSFGVFDTFNCAHTYLINMNLNQQEEEIARMQLKFDFYKKNGFFPKRITPSPTRHSLIIYGGKYTREKFLQVIKELEKQDKLSDNVLIPLYVKK